MKLLTALAQATKALDEGAIQAPRLTAEVLLAHALRKDRAWLYAHGPDELSELGWIHFGRYLHERLKGKPTQYITKRQEFYGRDFFVSPDVLIPRSETEHLVERAIAERPGRVLDIGAGSGAIAVTLALESACSAFATDVSAPALAVARRNAADLGARVGFAQCDLGSAFADCSFDLVVSNPPYVATADMPSLQREVRDWEPHLALFGGPLGHEIYGRLFADAWRLLSAGGIVIAELGAGGADAVTPLLAGWTNIEVMPDLAGIARVATARKPH